MVEEIAVLLEGGGEISAAAAAAVILRTTPITERTLENTAGDERRGRVRLRGEEIAERTEEETEIEDEGILDLDLVRLLQRLVLDLGLALARESGTAEEAEMNEVDDATIARDLDRRLREEESLGITTMTTIKITRWMMAVNKDAEGHHGETRRTAAETGRLRIRVQGLQTSDEDEEEEVIESIRSRSKKVTIRKVGKYTRLLHTTTFAKTHLLDITRPLSNYLYEPSFSLSLSLFTSRSHPQPPLLSSPRHHPKSPALISARLKNKSPTRCYLRSSSSTAPTSPRD